MSTPKSGTQQLKKKPSFSSLFSFKQREIDAVFARATPLASMPGIKLLYALPAEKALHGKFLIVIPRIVSKAHARNRLRRQLKALYYEQGWYAVSGVLIALLYKEATTLNVNQLHTFIGGALKRCSR